MNNFEKFIERNPYIVFVIIITICIFADNL